MTKEIKRENYLKNGIDFDDIYLDKKGQYHIYGINIESYGFKKGDKLILDLCYLTGNTFINATIKRIYANSFIVDYEYIY